MKRSKELDHDQYLSVIPDSPKICFFCKQNHIKKWRFWVNKRTRSFWVCSVCIDQIGGNGEVIKALEKLPFTQNQTKFFLKKGGIKNET